MTDPVPASARGQSDQMSGYVAELVPAGPLPVDPQVIAALRDLAASTKRIATHLERMTSMTLAVAIRDGMVDLDEIDLSDMSTSRAAAAAPAAQAEEVATYCQLLLGGGTC